MASLNSNPVRAGFYTLGCKLNQVESEALASSFRSQGFCVSPVSEKADLFIINSCTVTSKSEQKTRRMIRKFSSENPDSVLIVTGCYAEMDPDKIKNIDPDIIVLSNENKDILLDLPLEITGRPGKKKDWMRDLRKRIDKLLAGKDKNAPCASFRFNTNFYNFHARAFLKIQDGCDNKCSYCRVTLARGKSVSYGSDEIIKRIRAVEGNGYSEVVLTGVNICSYREAGMTLSDLVQKILDNTDSIRLRLSSLEPDTIDEKLSRVLKSKRICPHFHISLQSGSDDVLKLMKRKYLADKITEGVSFLRKIHEDPFIGADVIAGFPGETEEDFKTTYDLVEKLEFSDIHVFKYSSRPGTSAASMENHIPEIIKKRRVKLLNELSKRLLREYTKRWAGRYVDVVIEDEVNSGEWRGVSENYLRLIVRNVPEEYGHSGKICRVRIKTGEDIRSGRFISGV